MFKLTFIRVYRMPEKLTGALFEHGHPVTFAVVDWFDAPEGIMEDALADFIKKKPYYQPHFSYLVLGETSQTTFPMWGDQHKAPAVA